MSPNVAENPDWIKKFIEGGYGVKAEGAKLYVEMEKYDNLLNETRGFCMDVFHPKF